ncbi:MAG: hypothetical protein WA323_23120 [Candidatus Nitrosopolaris sp.]
MNVEIARRIASFAIIIRATAAPITFTVSTTAAHHQTRQKLLTQVEKLARIN